MATVCASFLESSPLDLLAIELTKTFMNVLITSWLRCRTREGVLVLAWAAGRVLLLLLLLPVGLTFVEERVVEFRAVWGGPVCVEEDAAVGAWLVPIRGVWVAAIKLGGAVVGKFIPCGRVIDWEDCAGAPGLVPFI